MINLTCVVCDFICTGMAIDTFNCPNDLQLLSLMCKHIQIRFTIKPSYLLDYFSSKVSCEENE